MAMRYSLFLISVLCLSILNSCNKNKEEEDLKIRYPNITDNGINILSGNNNKVFDATEKYGFGAKIGIKATLKVVLTNLPNDSSSIPNPRFHIITGTNKGWVVSEYTSGAQIFQVKEYQDELVDIQMEFVGEGAMRADFYENDTKISTSKLYYWD